MCSSDLFRDPLRVIPQSDDIVISAADGKVTRIEENEDGKLVSVFLSPLDVHINRSPIDGKVVRAEYIKGKKLPATRDESSLVNERNRITIEGNLIKSDVSFVVPNDDLLQLKSDSTAYKFGFQHLPINKIGLYKDKYRKAVS